MTVDYGDSAFYSAAPLISSPVRIFGPRFSGRKRRLVRFFEPGDKRHRSNRAADALAVPEPSLCLVVGGGIQQFGEIDEASARRGDVGHAVLA